MPVKILGYVKNKIEVKVNAVNWIAKKSESNLIQIRRKPSGNSGENDHDFDSDCQVCKLFLSQIR